MAQIYRFSVVCDATYQDLTPIERKLTEHFGDIIKDVRVDFDSEPSPELIAATWATLMKLPGVIDKSSFDQVT